MSATKKNINTHFEVVMVTLTIHILVVNKRERKFVQLKSAETSICRIRCPDTMSSKATVTSKSSIVWKIFTTEILDLFYLMLYHSWFSYQKFQSSLSGS